LRKKASELKLWGHAQSSAHLVLFDKHRLIAVFYRHVCYTFLVVKLWILLVASSTSTKVNG